MVQRLIDDIRKALDNDLYFVALGSALTLPDICGKAEYPTEDSSRKRYIEWYDNEIGQYERSSNSISKEPMPYLSGEVMYNLRCALLHEGNPNINNNELVRRNSLPIDRFKLKIESKKEIEIYSDSSSIETGVVQNVRSYTMSIRRICWILCYVAERYYADNKRKFHFNYEIVDWDKATENIPPISRDEVIEALLNTEEL